MRAEQLTAHISPPRGEAQAAGSALNEIRSARSKNAASPIVAPRHVYENIASTTPHVSIPLFTNMSDSVG